MSLTRVRRSSGTSVQLLGDVFDRRLNGLNALRLFFAAGVVVWHSFPLTGRTVAWAPARQILESVWVDGFFAISGFLILSSWMNNPNPRRFLMARSLRILPAYYVCLIVTAIFIVPLGVWLSGSSEPPLSWSSLSYVYKNAALWIFQYDVGATTSDLPFAGAINGSLWTLAWEFLCYLAVLALGVLGLLKFQGTLPLCFVGSWTLLFFTWNGEISASFARFGGRFAVAFLAGALIYYYQGRIPVTGKLVVLCAGIVLGSSLTPVFHLVSAPFLAYLVIGLGALLKSRRLVFPNDLSYGLYIYAFPVQQTLALAGLAFLPVLAFAALSLAISIGLAAASWFLVEKPFLRLRPKGPKDPRCHRSQLWRARAEEALRR